ncbi:hypothetical protein [Parapedobacter sp. 10938]|uniref:DUF7935 family protein n=1 Tax=Parapedobacter flavus TaxID=3110225 RepID=UPI002DBCA121|nr:hypothetical protein [Parapedobacter sp. 10938]MEC3878556.1 hypothetical protein [Parapedobacter sp. 10938]
MDVVSFSLELFKYILAGCVVAGVANWMFWTKYNSHTFRLKILEARQSAAKEVRPLQLQAYERLVLLIERINPANAALRLYSRDLDAKAFESLLIDEIRAEYQHNITQQLYVSDSAWSVTEQVKDNTIALIRNAGAGLPVGATAKELSTVLLAHIAALDDNPYDTALKSIKNQLMG